MTILFRPTLDTLCEQSERTCSGECDMQDFIAALLEEVPEEVERKPALDRDARKRDQAAWRERWG